MQSPLESRPVRILLVDDHPIVRHGLAALLKLEKDFELCGEAGTYEEAEEALARLQPDLVILDITLKERNGLPLIPFARKAAPNAKILVLSMHGERDYAETALRLGARGYIMKEQADTALVEALRALLRDEMFFSEQIMSRMTGSGVTAEPSTARPTRGFEALTVREREIFEMIGRGLTTRAIAKRLKLSRRTVEAHRAHIKNKLECTSAAEVVRAAVRWLEAGSSSRG